MDSDLLLHCFLRWGHILSAILWIGSLFCMALAIGPMIQRLEGELKKQMTLSFVPRGFYLIRLSSLTTIVFGLGVFWWNYMHKDLMMIEVLDPETGVLAKTLSDRARFIMYGMTLALFMAALLWLLVWPAQRKLFAALKAGQAPDPSLSKKTGLGCLLNLYLTGPMLMLMIMPGHYSSFNGSAILIASGGSMVLIHILRMVMKQTAPVS